MTRTITIVVAAILGISVGASLAEAALLVPFWREIKPDAFYDWYASNHARLVAFYSPMQISSAVAAAAVCVWLFIKKESGKWIMLISVILALAVLILFPVYFKAANTAFMERAIAAEQLPAVLESWGRWQWARVVLAGGAFLAALFSIPNTEN